MQGVFKDTVSLRYLEAALTSRLEEVESEDVLVEMHADISLHLLREILHHLHPDTATYK